VFGFRLLDGRWFELRDGSNAQPVVVLSRRCAQSLFGTVAKALGAIVRLEETSKNHSVATIVGIVDDPSTVAEEDGRTSGYIYIPFAQHFERSLAVGVRGAAPGTLIGPLQQISVRAEPKLRIVDAGTGVQVAGLDMSVFEVVSELGAVLGFAALCLAMVGLYGSLSCDLQQRRAEMAVRAALGADRKHMLKLVLGEALRPVVTGLAAGFACADLAEIALTPALTEPLPQVDSAILISVPVLFLMVAILCCLAPINRAWNMPPADGLRET